MKDFIVIRAIKSFIIKLFRYICCLSGIYLLTYEKVFCFNIICNHIISACNVSANI